MHILVADAIAHDVVPHGKRATLYLFMAFGKLHAVDVGRCPFVVKLLRVEVIEVIAGLRHDVNLTIGDAYKVISQLHHLVGLRVIVRPREHQHILHLNGRCAFGVRLLTPHHRLAVVLFHQTDIMVGESAELLHHILVFVRVLVGSYMHVFAAKNGVFSFKILGKERVAESNGVRIEQVEMVGRIILAHQVGAKTCQSQAVCRHINLGKYFYAHAVGQLLQGDKVFFCVMSIASREARKPITLHAESSRRAAPIFVVEPMEGVVVEVNVKNIHLIIGHHAHILAKHGHGEELSTAVEHKAAERIIGRIADKAAGQSARFRLFGQLQQGSGAPIKSLSVGGGDGGLGVNGHGVALFAQRLGGFKAQHDVAFLRLTLGKGQCRAEQLPIIVGQLLCNPPFFCTIAHNATRKSERAICPFPLLNLWNGERLFVDGECG